MVLGQESSTKSQIRVYGPDATTAGILEFVMSPNDGDPNIVAMTILGTGNVGIGTTGPGAGLDMGTTNNVRIPAQKSTTGQRYLCIDTNGQLVSSVTACVGT